MGMKIDTKRSQIKTQQASPGPGNYGLSEGSAAHLIKSKQHISDRMRGDMSTRYNTLGDQSLSLMEDSLQSKNPHNRSR